MTQMKKENIFNTFKNWCRGFAISLFVLVLSVPVMAQSLTPMRKAGTTPSDIKGFRLTVGNPYKQFMVFDLIAMDPTFTRTAMDAEVQPSQLSLAPGVSRQVIVMFKIPNEQKERTIGVCVVPKSIAGPVIPRVCGTYTGELLVR